MKRVCVGRQRTGKAAGKPRQFAAAPGTNLRRMADRDARRIRHRAHRTTEESRQDTAKTQEEQTTRAQSFRANLLRSFRRISADRISATRRAEYATQIQGFWNTLSQRLQNLRTARILAEQEEEDVAAEVGHLNDRVIAD